MFASQCSFDARWYGSRENKIARPEARSVDHQRSVLASQKAEVWASRCGRVNARALPKPTSTRLPTMLGTEPIAVSEYALFHGTSVHGIGAVVRDYLCRLLAGDSCAVASVVFAASVSVCARCACMFHNASSRACAHLRAHLFTLVFNIGACGRPCHRPMLRIHRQMHF